MLMHDKLNHGPSEWLDFFMYVLICFTFFKFVQDVKITDDRPSSIKDAGHAQLVEVLKKESIIQKSLDKIKETSTV